MLLSTYRSGRACVKTRIGDVIGCSFAVPSLKNSLSPWLLGRADNDDLHARSQGWWTGRAEPDRCVFAVKEASECYTANLAAYHRAVL